MTERNFLLLFWTYLVQCFYSTFTRLFHVYPAAVTSIRAIREMDCTELYYCYVDVQTIDYYTKHIILFCGPTKESPHQGLKANASPEWIYISTPV
jgi:hypothetical protein